MNFITADGHKFTHPLQHLGKTKKDLPVLAADTFRHMYLFKVWGFTCIGGEADGDVLLEGGNGRAYMVSHGMCLDSGMH